MPQEREHPGESRLSGNVIIGELLRNMELGRFEMAYTVLLPCVFTIYLNPEDHATLRGVFHLVTEDARKALRARVAEWNGSGKSAQGKSAQSGSTARKGSVAKEHKIACRDWELEFLPDAEVSAGDVEIHSELSEASPPGFRGIRTTLIGRDSAATHRLAANAPQRAPSGPIYAAIQFEDQRGPQTYFVTQDQVLIGRGDSAGLSVDLALHATDEVSRHHLMIRRDPATGSFSALDASTNGTWVNGKRLQKGTPDPLPDRARIGLGEVLTLLFEVRA